MEPRRRLESVRVNLLFSDFGNARQDGRCGQDFDYATCSFLPWDNSGEISPCCNEKSGKCGSGASFCSCKGSLWFKGIFFENYSYYYIGNLKFKFRADKVYLRANRFFKILFVSKEGLYHNNVMNQPIFTFIFISITLTLYGELWLFIAYK